MKTILEFYNTITISNYIEGTILSDINKIIIENKNCIFKRNNQEIKRLSIKENDLHYIIIRELDNANFYLSEKRLGSFVENGLLEPKNGKRTMVI